jgi:MscS family membrane protein
MRQLFPRTTRTRRSSALSAVLPTLLAVLLLTLPARAQAGAAAKMAADSPRAALDQFLQQGHDGHFDEASRALQLPANVPAEDAPRLARRLLFVLDRYIVFDLSQISGESQGNPNDGLTPDTEEIGHITLRAGVEEPVRLVRVETPKGQRWLFSEATVGRTDRWFSTLRDRWILERLPTALLRAGPGDILYWQWIGLLSLALVSWFLGFFLARITKAILGHLVKKTETKWDDAVLERIGGPLTLAWLIGVAAILLPLLGLPAGDETSARSVLQGGLYVVFFWALLRSVDVLIQVLRESSWSVQHEAAHSLLPLGGRVLKAVVLALAIVTALSAFGFPIASLLAGLGIGGLAIALAAQKTVENLVGAFSIGADQPFKHGDYIKVGEHSGHVEVIGLRSTRLRTLDRTIVTIPNGQISEQRVETFAVRDRVRLNLTVGLVYGTTRAQMLQILEGFERTMRGHPRCWPDTVVARFAGLGESSLDVEVLCWCNSSNYDDFRAFRQEVLLGFMDVVEKAGSGFAFPTRTVHVVEEHAASETKKG